jgi:L-asparaginase
VAVSESSRRVVVWGLGGTIAMAGTEAGGVPDLSPQQLLAAVPGLAGTGIAVQATDLRRLPGAWLRFEDLYELAAAIEGLPDADGVVVTQGTDTIEESAYLLDLLHRRPAPVVVTGAMRNPRLAGPDGPANLLAAVQVAASDQARDQGALVVFNDEIHAARRVRKTHATNVATFQSPNGGPLGYVVEGEPWFVNRLPHRTAVPVGAPDPLPRVGLVTIALGDDGAVFDVLADRVDGLVVAAFGAGHVPEWLVARLAELAARLPVVLGSRTGAGPVLRAIYDFAGSERDLQDRGLIGAGLLDPPKARILLHALLAARADRAAIGDAFAVAGGYASAERWPWPASASRSPAERGAGAHGLG